MLTSSIIGPQILKFERSPSLSSGPQRSLIPPFKISLGGSDYIYIYIYKVCLQWKRNCLHIWSTLLSSHVVYGGVRVAQSLDFCVVFWTIVTRSLVLCVCFVDNCLPFSIWPLYCLFFFDLRILNTPSDIFKLM